MERNELIKSLSEKIKTMNAYTKNLGYTPEFLPSIIKDYKAIRACIENDGDLNGIQKISKYNFVNYFEVDFETHVLGKSLRNLLDEIGTSINNIVGLKKVELPTNRGMIYF